MATGFIPPHGGYENLPSFQKSRIVYDATVCFREMWRSRPRLRSFLPAHRRGRLCHIRRDAA